LEADQVRRIGYLSSLAETDLDGRTWDSAFRMGLTELGWIEGRNVHADYRWAAGNVDRLQLLADELVGLKPEVIFAVSTPATAARSGYLPFNGHDYFASVRLHLDAPRVHLMIVSCQPPPARHFVSAIHPEAFFFETLLRPPHVSGKRGQACLKFFRPICRNCTRPSSSC
jgi:hypothetical protein